MRKIKPEWDTPKDSLLSKGMGVGALLKVYNLLFPIIFSRELKLRWDDIHKLDIDDYVNILAGIENVDFLTDGEFGKTGSAGSINKIKETIIKNLEYVGSPLSYQVFEDSYKSEYLPIFNTSLNNLKSTGQLKLVM